MNDKLTDQSVSEIDRALAAAKARKEAKANGTAQASKPGVPREPKAPRVSDEEKAARKAAKATERLAELAIRKQARADRAAARAATRQQPHLRKVARAAEKLGVLSDQATLIFSEATANLSATMLAALASHLQHFNRVKATERALTQTVEAGQSVTIVGGDPRFIGKTGTIERAQRIRCYVTLEGQPKAVYMFTSDVQVNVSPSATASA